MNNNGIPDTKIHSYNVSVAADTKNINAAVIFHNICFWVEQNYANERNFINGKYWTYNTVKAFRTMFPEMTANQISYALQKLEEKGYIESAFLCEDTRDRTKWYTVCDFDKWIHVQKSNSEISNMAKENSNMGAENSEMFNNNINTKDTDTDNKQSNNNQTDNKITDNSHDKYTLEDVKRPSSKGNIYTSVPEEHKDAPPKKQSRYIPPDYTEEQLIEHIRPTIEDNLKTVMEDCGVEYNPDMADTLVEVVRDFYSQYHEATGNRHRILPDASLINVMYKFFDPPEELFDAPYDVDMYATLAEGYFSAKFDKEYTPSISHFMGKQMRAILYHRTK